MIFSCGQEPIRGILICYLMGICCLPQKVGMVSIISASRRIIRTLMPQTFGKDLGHNYTIMKHFQWFLFPIFLSPFEVWNFKPCVEMSRESIFLDLRVASKDHVSFKEGVRNVSQETIRGGIEVRSRCEVTRRIFLQGNGFTCPTYPKSSMFSNSKIMSGVAV